MNSYNLSLKSSNFNITRPLFITTYYNSLPEFYQVNSFASLDSDTPIFIGSPYQVSTIPFDLKIRGSKKHHDFFDIRTKEGYQFPNIFTPDITGKDYHTLQYLRTMTRVIGRKVYPYFFNEVPPQEGEISTYLDVMTYIHKHYVYYKGLLFRINMNIIDDADPTGTIYPYYQVDRLYNYKYILNPGNMHIYNENIKRPTLKRKYQPVRIYHYNDIKDLLDTIPPQFKPPKNRRVRKGLAPLEMLYPGKPRGESQEELGMSDDEYDNRYTAPLAYKQRIKSSPEDVRKRVQRDYIRDDKEFCWRIDYNSFNMDGGDVALLSRQEEIDAIVNQDRMGMLGLDS